MIRLARHAQALVETIALRAWLVGGYTLAGLATTAMTAVVMQTAKCQTPIAAHRTQCVITVILLVPLAALVDPAVAQAAILAMSFKVATDNAKSAA